MEAKKTMEITRIDSKAYTDLHKDIKYQLMYWVMIHTITYIKFLDK